MPEGARHDENLCSFCRADSADKSRASVPSGDTPSGATDSDDNPTTEGGTQDTMTEKANETISRETHEALITKAVADATTTIDKALAAKTDEASDLTAKVDKLSTDNATLKSDNERLNKELDAAQVSLKNATDEVATLKAENASKDEAARLAEVAQKRSDQVKNLDLFPESYVSEKAAKWAAMSDEDWADRIDEWQKAKPEAAKGDDKTGKADTASAMTGTSGDLTKDTDAANDSKPSARRAVLGLH